MPIAKSRYLSSLVRGRCEGATGSVASKATRSEALAALVCLSHQPPLDSIWRSDSRQKRCHSHLVHTSRQRVAQVAGKRSVTARVTLRRLALRKQLRRQTCRHTHRKHVCADSHESEWLFVTFSTESKADEASVTATLAPRIENSSVAVFYSLFYRRTGLRT